MQREDGTNTFRSLNITISEIERYLDGQDSDAAHGELRSRLNGKLADLSEWWFREGFALAHKICLQKIADGDSIASISLAEEQAWLGPRIERTVVIVSPSKDHPDASWKI